MGKDKTPKNNNPKASKGSSLGIFGRAWGEDKNGKGGKRK